MAHLLDAELDATFVDLRIRTPGLPHPLLHMGGLEVPVRKLTLGCLEFIVDHVPQRICHKDTPSIVHNTAGALRQLVAETLEQVQEAQGKEDRDTAG